MSNDVSRRLLDHLKHTHPGLAVRAQRSAVAAIRLHCLECLGGSPMEVRQCGNSVCPLHPFRMGHRPEGEQKKELPPDHPFRKPKSEPTDDDPWADA